MEGRVVGSRCGHYVFYSVKPNLKLTGELVGNKGIGYCMGYSLNSGKGLYWGLLGITIGVIKGDTRNLDRSSYRVYTGIYSLIP